MINPTDHMSYFPTTLDLYDAIDVAKCQMFLANLKAWLEHGLICSLFNQSTTSNNFTEFL